MYFDYNQGLHLKKNISNSFPYKNFTIPEWLKNVAWLESNHFGGKKRKEVAWLGFELTTSILEGESANHYTMAPS